MTVLGGGLFLIEVETAPNVFTECADLTRVTKSNNVTITRTRVFRKTYRAASATDFTFTLAGLLNYADPGQAALLAAERTNTDIRIRWSEEGSSTIFNQATVRVATITHDGTPAPGELQTISYEVRSAVRPTKIDLSQDGSVLDLQNTFGDENLVGVWDLSKVSSVHVNGTTQIDSVDDARGAGVGLPMIGALADGSLGSHKPGWDAANKQALFTLGQPTQTRLGTALDARYSLNGQALALVVWGGFNAGEGSYAVRIVHSDGLRGVGLIGAFGHATFDLLLQADATHAYSGGYPSGMRVMPNVAGVAARTRVISIKKPVIAASGFEGSFPFHSAESPGNERVLMFASGLNEYTPPIAGTYQIILGGAVTEGILRGAALIKLDALLDQSLSRVHMAALERFGTRLGCVTTNTAGAKGVTCDGDSRMWGNGASNFNTDPISVQLQALLDATAPGVYHTQNRGIEGDSWHDRANIAARVYTPEFWRQRAANDADTHRAGPDIHVYLLDVNDVNGPGTGNGFGNTVASADVALAQLAIEFAAAVADNKRVVVCAPFFPIVDPFRTEWLNGLLAFETAHSSNFAVARTDLDARLATNDVTYFTDGLHQTPAGMGVIAGIIHDKIIAKGW
jgi:lysophospholipase L1-like esterase